MKKLIVLSVLFACLNSAGQMLNDWIILTVPAGADTSFTELFYTVDPWALQINTENLDGTDTLALYSTEDKDTALYDLVWFDQDLDGTNDNPFTLPDSSMTIRGDNYSSKYIRYELIKGTSTTGAKMYIKRTRR